MFEGKIFTAVLGMSSGLTVQQWSTKGVETVCQMTIPWMVEGKNIFWPNKWIEDAVEMVNSYAHSGDTIAWAMPGADLACVRKHRIESAFCLALPLLNYRSLVDGAVFQKISESVNPKEAYRKIGGANWAFFQPPSHIFCYLKELQSDENVKVITLADWITYLASGGNDKSLKHDPNMLQSQGLYSWVAKGLYLELFGEELSKRIAPFDLFEPDTYITRSDNQVRVIPCSHDSVARKIGFSVCRSGIWTGTWVGTDDLIGDKNIQPSGRTFDAGIAFEGLGNLRALITNISMAGAVYKAIVQKCGWRSYKEASIIAEKALHNHGDQVVFDIDELPADATMAAEFILKKSLNNGAYALAYLLQSLAAACRKKKELVYRILRRKVPEKTAVFGGFAENIAFLQALENFGFEPIVPKFAANATHAGLAMEALIRTGQATNDQEALNMLQEK